MDRQQHQQGQREDRRRRASLAAVLSSTLGLGVAYGAGYTITSVRFDAWGAPGWLTGAAGSAPAVAVVLLIPFAPRVAARLGAVRAMVAGAALVALTFALMPVLDAAGWWLLLRFASGAGLALPWLVGETWINTVATDATRGRVLATYTVLLFGGWATGPLLVQRAGPDSPLPYVVGVVGMALTALPLLLARHLAPPVHVSGRFSLRAAVTLAPLAIPAAFVGGVAEFTYISLLPVYATQAGAAADDGLLLLSTLMAGGIVLQFAVGWLADRVDRARLLAALGVALAATTVLLGVLVHRGGLATVAAFVLGGVVLGFYAVGLALLGEQTPPGHLALANAAFLMAYELGAVAGPLAGGAAMDLVRPHGLAAVVATAGLAFALHAWRHRSRRFRPARRPAAIARPR